MITGIEEDFESSIAGLCRVDCPKKELHPKNPQVAFYEKDYEQQEETYQVHFYKKLIGKLHFGYLYEYNKPMMIRKFKVGILVVPSQKNRKKGNIGESKCHFRTVFIREGTPLAGIYHEIKRVSEGFRKKKKK